jgi:hypothetical protein
VCSQLLNSDSNPSFEVLFIKTTKGYTARSVQFDGCSGWGYTEEAALKKLIIAISKQSGENMKTNMEKLITDGDFVDIANKEMKNQNEFNRSYFIPGNEKLEIEDIFEEKKPVLGYPDEKITLNAQRIVFSIQDPVSDDSIEEIAFAFPISFN